MGVVLPFPAPIRDSGTLHVAPCRDGGFIVCHESRSGDSWGDTRGPFRTGQQAIAVAYATNRDDYGGDCDVAICPAALTITAAERIEDF